MLWFLGGYSGIQAASGAASSTKASLTIHMEIRAFYTPPRHTGMGTARWKNMLEEHIFLPFGVGKDEVAQQSCQEVFKNKGLGSGHLPVP